MSLNIDKKEMDCAWQNRHNDNKFYEYLYDIAKLQVSRKGIPHKDFSDYVQFAILKCFKHEDSFKPAKGAAYSFFWKQISLAIAYKQRKEARRNTKARTFYVDQEKILDWMERQQEDEGVKLTDIVEEDEIAQIKKAFKEYNKNHKDKIKPSCKANIKRVIIWSNKVDPNFLEKFSTLKFIFKNWINEAVNKK